MGCSKTGRLRFLVDCKKAKKLAWIALAAELVFAILVALYMCLLHPAILFSLTKGGEPAWPRVQVDTQDPAISWQFDTRTIPYSQPLFVIIGACALFLVADAVHVIVYHRLRYSWLRAFINVVALVDGVSLHCIFNAIKPIVLRFRPDFLDRCHPVIEPLEPGSTRGWITRCNVDASRFHRALDGFQSFPSGHTASAFFAAGVFAVGIFRLFPAVGLSPTPEGPDDGDSSQSDPDLDSGSQPPIRPIVPAGSSFLCVVLALIPGVWAVYVGASRWYDRRHFATDILTGAVIGAASAAAVPVIARRHIRNYAPATLLVEGGRVFY